MDNIAIAIKSENSFIVERLLECNADSPGLDMIRQRAHKSDNINSIILSAAEEGCLLLLESLCISRLNGKHLQM